MSVSTIGLALGGLAVAAALIAVWLRRAGGRHRSNRPRGRGWPW